jgi:hypothetical protein
LSRCSGASGCPGPLLTPCFASCSSLLMQKRRRSVTSLARRTGGSDSPLMRLLTFAPLSRCSLGPLGRDDLPPASLLPPLKGRAVIAIERGSVSGRGMGGQSDGYRTHQRTVARFVGRVQPGRSRPNRKPKRAGHGHTARLRDASAACRAVCLGGPCVKIKLNSAQFRYFVNRTTHRFYFHPAHADVLYAFTSMNVW